MTFYADREENGVLLRWCPGCEKWKPKQRSFRATKARVCRTCENSKRAARDDGHKAYRGAKRYYMQSGGERSPFAGDCIDTVALDKFLRSRL